MVDVVGELGAWWGTAHVAFVGGSLGSRGGQNMIEPAAYGAAVSFGPNTWNFRDVVSAMLAHDAAVVVRDGEELTAFVRRCLEQPDYAAEIGRRAQAFVQSQIGATERTLRLLRTLLVWCESRMRLDWSRRRFRGPARRVAGPGRQSRSDRPRTSGQGRPPINADIPDA